MYTSTNFYKLGRCYHISSISEKKAKKLKRTDRSGFIHHTNNQLVRIYPKGSRTDSSNYNPVPFWNVGCQVGRLRFFFAFIRCAFVILRFLTFKKCFALLFSCLELSNKWFLQSNKRRRVSSEWKLRVSSKAYRPT